MKQVTIFVIQFTEDVTAETMSDKPAVPGNNGLDPLPSYDEGLGSRFLRKTKDAPYVPLGKIIYGFSFYKITFYYV